MSLRINPDLFSTLLPALGQDRQRVNTALAQISSGLRVTSLSDDPFAVAGLVLNQTESDTAAQFTQSIASVQARLQTADSSLNSIVQALNRAISLGIQGANGTLSDTERQQLANEVGTIKQQVVDLANTAFQGKYIYAGTAVTTQPYVLDSTSPSGVRYVGNNSVNNVQVGQSEFVPINAPGSTIFNGSGADVFQALHDLVAGLQSGTGIPAANAELSAAFSNVNLQRTFYGNTLDRLSAANLNLSQEKVTLTQQKTDLVGADLARAATDLAQSETTLNASLAAFGRISQNSLFNFLK